MIEIDFLPVESATGPGSKSGDAIALRFAKDGENTPTVVVIDGGYGAVGLKLAHHIRTFYGTSHIDLVVSTHPDADHLNGLIALIEEMEVDELMIHQPWKHRDDVDSYSNIQKIRDLVATAIARGTAVSEPFEGAQRFDGRFRVLGPSADYYEELLDLDLTEARARLEAAVAAATVFAKGPAEDEEEKPLTDVELTSARNRTSVVSLVTVDDEHHMFTGDAGLASLERAADEFERTVSPIIATRFEFFQVPHHGSRRNLSDALLDRLFPFGGSTAFISSGLADEKHPGGAVIDALATRGFDIHATEGKHLLHHHGGKPRAGYSAAIPRS